MDGTQRSTTYRFKVLGPPRLEVSPAGVGDVVPAHSPSLCDDEPLSVLRASTEGEVAIAYDREWQKALAFLNRVARKAWNIERCFASPSRRDGLRLSGEKVGDL